MGDERKEGEGHTAFLVCRVYFLDAIAAKARSESVVCCGYDGGDDVS